MDALLVAEMAFVVINTESVSFDDATLRPFAISNAIKLHLMNPLCSNHRRNEDGVTDNS